MDDQTLKAIIVGILAGGCGGANQLLLAQIIKWKDEDGQPISPKTKRRLSLLLAFVTPSVLYGFIVAMSWVQYGVAAHIAYMGLAFAAHQAIHGETKLLTGTEERLAYYTKDQPTGTKIPMGDNPSARIQKGKAQYFDGYLANRTATTPPPTLPIAPAAPTFTDGERSADTVDLTNSGDVQPYKGM